MTKQAEMNASTTRIKRFMLNFLEKVLLTQTSERDDRDNTPLDIIGNFLLALSRIDRSQSRRHNARVPESGGVRLANAIVIDTNSIEPVVRLWRRAAWFSGISTD